MQNTDKIHIQYLAEICAQKGIKQVVLSPGSRCAPLVIAFNRHPKLNCYSIVDERSAAFFALGMAQQSNKPVALICTSGSAVLNYAPAVAEAFYQKIPLLLLTADRPNEWIDQGENQSIQQFEVFKNYIKKSYQLPVHIATDEDLWYSNRLISEAINTCLHNDFGPVHINIPLREPLYNLVTVAEAIKPKIVSFSKVKKQLCETELSHLKTKWKAANKKLIIVGQKNKDAEIDKVLAKFENQKDVVILYESISNVNIKNGFGQIDPLIEVIDSNNEKAFSPELILTFGNGIVSKKLKFWLRKQKELSHWHISKSGEHWDNFQALSYVLESEINLILENLLENYTEKKYSYFELWNTLQKKINHFTQSYLNDIAFSDFKVFEKLCAHFPKNANVHFGNSTPVRYANLLKTKVEQVNANRGVSGIDGQVSTALGASLVNKKPTICISGDLALMYDSNALWNNYLHKNFKLILINNNGGNIFKIIPGPNQLDELGTYFETKSNYDASHLAALHRLKYFSIENETTFETTLNAFFNEDKIACLLEIKTNGDLSADNLRNYFTHLKNL